MGVIVHHDGRREVLAYGADDPDACTTLVSLTERDTQTMAEILGVSHISETVSEIRQSIEGLVIEWIEVTGASGMGGKSIGAGQFRTRTGASIVAVIRDHVPLPAPGPEFVLSAGDMVVAVGTQDGIVQLRALLGH